jgi:predicted nucleic acid-binding protein
MVALALPDSHDSITRARAGLDPFAELASCAGGWDFATCGMVVIEVCRGRRDSALHQRFRENFAIMPYIATGSTVWERAEQLAWSLDRQGVVLPAPDLLIAACALHANAAVLTADAHFSRIPGLRVLDRLS